ncbi:MAG: P2 family phage major capsid protein [Pasteurellaceae bacterium]|nr:P2 family phage major capsid protein [Pasteurellaceae bacterium]
MEKLTKQKYNAYIEHYAKSMKLEKTGDLTIFDTDLQYEINLLEQLRNNSLLGLINIVRPMNHQGESLGIQLPMPSTTNTDNADREPTKGYITPPQTFYCQPMHIDTCISYTKLDVLRDYLTEEFNQHFDNLLNKNIINSLLLAGFNGEKRAITSDSNQNKFAQDVAVGWLQKIRQQGASQVINATSQSFNNLTAVINAGLDKIERPRQLSGDYVAICGRNVLPDFPVNNALSTTTYKIYDKQQGGVTLMNAPYFPENSVLITQLDNLSIYIKSGSIRRFIEDNPSKNRLENYFELELDYLVEDYRSVALIENITLNH